jgi:hypothetical protein
LPNSNPRSELSLLGAFIEISDLAKLKRFDELADEVGHGRNLLQLLSRPGEASEHLWGRQYELRRQGKDAFALCRDIQDLFGALVADFLAAGAAGRFSAKGFLGADEKTVPLRMFGDSRLRLRLDEDAIELPDGSTLGCVSVDIHRNHDAAAPSDGDAVPSAATLRRKRGPVPGELDRYGAADRALFNDLERIMQQSMVSVTEAAKHLAESKKVAGIGSDLSRAKRLAQRYRRERQT